MPANSRWDLIRALKGWTNPPFPILLCNMELNFIFPSSSRYSKWSLSFMFPEQILGAFLMSACVPYDLPISLPLILLCPLACHTTCHSRYPWSYYPHNIWCGEEIFHFLFMSFSPHFCYLFPFRPQNVSQHSIPRYPQHMFPHLQ